MSVGFRDHKDRADWEDLRTRNLSVACLPFGRPFGCKKRDACTDGRGGRLYRGSESLLGSGLQASCHIPVFRNRARQHNRDPQTQDLILPTGFSYPHFHAPHFGRAVQESTQVCLLFHSQVVVEVVGIKIEGDRVLIDMLSGLGPAQRAPGFYYGCPSGSTSHGAQTF